MSLACQSPTLRVKNRLRAFKSLYTHNCSPLSLLEIRSSRIVVQQVVRRNPVLGRVAGHELPGDAVGPGILFELDLPADVIHFVAPGPAGAGHVEALDRMLLAVVAHVAEYAQLTTTAIGLGAELLIEFLAQMGVAVQPEHDPLIVLPLYGQGHRRLARRQRIDAPFHVIDTDSAVEPLLDRRGNLATVAGLGIRRDQRLPFGLGEPQHIALRLGQAAVRVLLVVVFLGPDDLVFLILPQVGAVAADDESVWRGRWNRPLGRLRLRRIVESRQALFPGQPGVFLEYGLEIALAKFESFLPQGLAAGRGDDEMIAPRADLLAELQLV